MGPNPMNNGNVFLEEARKKYELMNSRILYFSKIAVVSLLIPIIITLLTIFLVSEIAGIAHLIVLIIWRIFIIRARPNNRINDEQFRNAFYGDVYAYNDINIEEVLTWLENIMEAIGIINTLTYVTIVIAGIIPIIIDLTIIACKFIL